MKKTKVKTEEKPKRIDPRWELFGTLFASGTNRNTFNNALRSYAIAYDYEPKIDKLKEELTLIPYSRDKERKEKREEILRIENVCKTCGAKLLTNAIILEIVNRIYKESFTEVEADNQLNKAMKQDKDYASKVAAVREFNRLKNRVEEKIINNNIVYTWKNKEDLSKGAKLEDKK